MAARRWWPVIGGVTVGVVAAVAGAAAIAAAEPGTDIDQVGISAAAVEAGQRRMTAAEVPAAVLEPAGTGSGTAASFAAFWSTVASATSGTPAPHPDDGPGLVARTDASAAGRVASVTLVPTVVELGELSAARLDLVVVLDDVVAIEAPQGVDLTTWTKTVWMGDGVMAEGMVGRLEAELGPGPVGADAVLFGNLVDGVLGVFDGVVDDGTSVARMSLVRPQPAGDLTSASEALAASG